MPGGIMQLVAYGAEDLYLTGNPQITYFKVVYRRHTNFSMEYIPQFFYSLPNFSFSNRSESKVKIDRNADLLHDCYLVFDTPNIRVPLEDFQNIRPDTTVEDINFKWVRNIGYNLINNVRVEVGGYDIDKHYGQWLQIWADLTTPDSKRRALSRLVGEKYYKLRPGFSRFYPNKGENLTIPATRLYVPLQFWFCENPGLAIPLIALQYSEVWIYFDFNPINDLWTLGPENLSPTAYFSTGNISNGPDDSLQLALSNAGFNDQTILNEFIVGDWNQNSFLLANYIYMDDDERRRFAQSSHEYLIHQVQRRLFTGIQQGPGSVELDLFHPVKELIWAFQKDTVGELNDWQNYSFLDLKNDYNQLKDEYNNKFDFLFQQADTQFMNSVNNFITTSETNPSPIIEPTFLGAGLSPTMAFNDYVNVMLSAFLRFNGHQRFCEEDYTFFNSLQPYKYHTHSAQDGIHVYSFALYPEQHQPSGTANFSRINKIELVFTVRRDTPLCSGNPIDPNTNEQLIECPVNYNLYVYAVNYNIFRVMGGLGGLAFNLN